jgi:hypothetical protein
VISTEDWITMRNLKKLNPKMGTRVISKQLDLSKNAVKNALRSEGPSAKHLSIFHIGAGLV